MLSREELLKREYESKLVALRNEQAYCSHEWGEVKYDPEITQEPIYETHWQGVDCWPALVGTGPVSTPRWSRTCKKCGKVEYTKEQVATHYEPKF